eukprot:COSAG02_NODE_3076_length_7420_cov_3.302145_6_plen_339_part_00
MSVTLSLVHHLPEGEKGLFMPLLALTYLSALYRYEIDLHGTREVLGLITKGRAGFAQKAQEWVTHYRVRYTTDSRHAFQQWIDVRHDHTSTAEPVIFFANRDTDSPFESTFPMPIEARYIRVFPVRWNKFIALRCGAICTDKIIPPSRTVSPAVSVGSSNASPLNARESQHVRWSNLLQSDPGSLVGLDVEVLSTSASTWVKGRIIGIHDIATGQVRVQYFVSANTCQHGVGGQREKVVSITDPKLLRESEDTMTKPVVAEPPGARKSLGGDVVPGNKTADGGGHPDEAAEDEGVLIHPDQCPQVRVEVAYSISQSGKDVYDVAILIGSSKIHSVVGK